MTNTNTTTAVQAREDYNYWNTLFGYAIRTAWETNACATRSEAEQHVEALDTAAEAARGMRTARRAMKSLSTANRGAQA